MVNMVNVVATESEVLNIKCLKINLSRMFLLIYIDVLRKYLF